MTNPNADKPQDDAAPKIIVDEDWKTQVQVEKETVKKEHVTEPQGPAGEAHIPEASFPMLVTTLATQATVALGQLAAPDADEIPVDLPLAKHLIDTLAILEDKTRGNLTQEESAMLINVLHQLRMLFVAVQSHIQKTPATKNSIELP